MSIKIKGVIGLDVIGTTFADTISRCDGDINLEIDSPGGTVFDGISIANALESYSKGKINVKVVGECSSMAAYIMLFGDTLTFKPNATVVLHNPWNLCVGDYRAMQKQANILERFAALYANKFIEKGIFTEKEIRSIMDEETYFIGESDLKRLGDIDKSSVKTENKELDRETQIALAQESIKQCQARMRQSEFNDLEKVAALIPQTNIIQAAASEKGLSLKTPACTSENKTGATFVRQSVEIEVQKKGEKIMDLNELKTQNPDVYAQAVKIGEEKNQTRINALMEFIDIDRETVVQAIASGKSVKDDDIQAKFLKAKINASAVAQMENDNPPQVNPKEPEHAPEDEGKAKEKEEEEKAKQEEKELNEACAYLGLKI